MISDEWKEVDLMRLLNRITTRMSAHFIVGPDLCKNDSSRPSFTPSLSIFYQSDGEQNTALQKLDVLSSRLSNDVERSKLRVLKAT